MTSISVFSCRTTKNKNVLFETAINGTVEVNSSCRNSLYLPLKNDSALIAELKKNSADAMREVKIRTNQSVEKSNYKIEKVILIVYETCGANLIKNKVPLRLEEKITLTNIETTQAIDFTTDTIINDQILSAPKQIETKKVDFSKYIPILSLKNYSKIKDFMKHQK